MIRGPARLAGEHWPLAAIVGVAAALRLHELGRDGLWADEAFSVVWSRLPLDRLLQQLREDCHAPLSYLLRKGFTAVLGDGEWALRLPSVLLGLATIVVVYGLARRAFSPPAGAFAAFLLAVSPIHVHYSREARPYALLLLLAASAAWLALETDRRPGPGRAAGLAGCLVAMLYTHNLGVFLAAGLLGWFLLKSLLVPGDRPGARTWWTVAGAVTVAYLPWLAVAARQAGQAEVVFGWARAGWEERFPWQPLLSAAALSHGSMAPVRNEVRAVTPAAWLAVGLEAALILSCLRRGDRAGRDAGASLVAAGLLGLAGIFLYSLLATPIYVVGRVDVIALPLLVAAVAGGLAALPRRLALAAALGLALLAAHPLLVALGTDFRSQERRIASFLSESMDPGGTLVVTGPFLTTQQYYLGRWRPDTILRVFPPGRAGHPGWVDWEGFTPGRLEAEARALASEVAGPDAAGRDVWLLLNPGHGNPAIGEALSRLRAETGRFGTGYLGIQLIRFGPAGPS